MPTLTAKILLATVLAPCAFTQEPPAIFEVEVENYVGYTGDTTDPARVAKSAVPVAPAAPVNFYNNVILADVTKINGAAAKGVMVIRTQTLLLNPTPVSGGAVADVTRVATADFNWEFLTADGTPIGSIFGAGLSGGLPAPGSPLTATSGNIAIVGGTGAFVGARGTINSVDATAVRSTSQAEDPSARRRLGGGRVRFILQVYPLSRPEVIVDTNGPQVFHSDDTPVSADSPAHAGETLTLNARGVINASVEVLVNGTPVPGATNVNRITFAIPSATLVGNAAIQLRAAWIMGSTVSIPVQ